MTDAPEKIWANKEFGSDDWDAGTFCTTDDGGTPYIKTAFLVAAQARITELEWALKDVIVMLDDPTGDEHVRDMRGATIIARKVLKKSET